MDIVIGIYLIIHGFAHLVGFLVSWKIIKDKDNPFKTTLLNGRIDVGFSGMRTVGLVWLFLAITYMLGAYGAISEALWWYSLIVVITWVSLIFTILGWPDTKFGIVANIILLVYLWIAPGLGWIQL